MENNTELYKALIAFQKDLQPIKKTEKNPHFKYNYADINSILDVIRAPLSKNGLFLTQLLTIIDGKSCLKTMLIHESGQCLESICLIEPQQKTPQAFGSEITYMRRYSISGILCLSAKDDDGNLASQHSQSINQNINGAYPKQSQKPTSFTEDEKQRLQAIVSEMEIYAQDNDQLEEFVKLKERARIFCNTKPYGGAMQSLKGLKAEQMKTNYETAKGR